MSSADLVVLGAGPAGLAAAWRAARSGRSVTVLERAPVIGGMAGSFEVAGVRVDHGSHRLHPRDVLTAARGPARPARRRPAAASALRPLHVGDCGSGSAGRGRAGATDPPTDARGNGRRRRHGSRAAPAVTSCELRGRADPWARTDALPGALRAVRPSSCGAPRRRIDAEQARRRVTADTPWKIAARIVRRGGNGQGRLFHYPAARLGQIVEALAQAASDAGVRIALGTAAEQLVPGPIGVRVRLGDGRSIEGRPGVLDGAAPDSGEDRHPSPPSGRSPARRS